MVLAAELSLLLPEDFLTCSLARSTALVFEPFSIDVFTRVLCNSKYDPIIATTGTLLSEERQPLVVEMGSHLLTK